MEQYNFNQNNLPQKARPCVSAVFFGKTPETAVERCK